jgi:hypothetical protein
MRRPSCERVSRFLVTSGSLGVILMLAPLVTSCGDPDRSAGNFCTELAKELPALDAPLAEPDDVNDVVARYRRLDAITPLAIEAEWSILTDLMELAADVDVADPVARQEVADAAYRAERPARDVAIWVETTCGLAMPDVIGVEGSVPVTIPPTAPPAPLATDPATGSITPAPSTSA